MPTSSSGKNRLSIRVGEVVHACGVCVRASASVHVNMCVPVSACVSVCLRVHIIVYMCIHLWLARMCLSSTILSKAYQSAAAVWLPRTVILCLHSPMM